MKVLREDLVSLCKAIGFKTAGEWNDDKLVEKVQMIVRNFSPGGAYSVDDLTLTEEQADLMERMISVKGRVQVVNQIEEDETTKSQVSDEVVGDEPVETAEPVKQETASVGSTSVVAKKRGRPKKSEVQKVAGKKREMTRVESVCKAFKSIQKGQTLDDVARIANDLYVKSGGRDSLKQSRLVVDQILPAAVEFGVVLPARVELTPVK